MADSMIERAAEAIFEVWAMDAGLPPDDRNWSEVVRVGHPIVAIARKEARAVIEAMREPTASMCAAAESKSQRGGFEPSGTWQLMIDAALAPSL